MTRPVTPEATSCQKGSATTQSESSDESVAIDVAAGSTIDDCSTAQPEATGDALTDEECAAEIAPIERSRQGIVVATLLPLVLMGMAVGAGYLKYRDGSVAEAQTAAIASVQAATEGTIALLSYSPDTAQATLTAARDRLTGAFRDSYTALTNDVVIPGAKQKRISATATVPAASSISANENHAVVLVFVDQSATVGDDAPSATASTVQVTLDRTGGRWLISGFDPK